MNKRTDYLVSKLISSHSLTADEYRELIEQRDGESTLRLQQEAVRLRKQIYGDKVFIRGLIEVSNICKNDCYYCGIRKSNRLCERYRLSKEEILSCCRDGYDLGFRTFVMQGGEDGAFSDAFLCDVIREIKELYPDCAVTLSLGERSRESYKRLYEAGADRYLLRHETADEKHYSMLHPENLTLASRMECLRALKETGFQTGCGFMVGSPYQTAEHLAKDLKFIGDFRPDMVGIGPFIPHKDTPFADHPAGSAELTCFLLSVIRIIHPPVLLPATTALGTLEDGGRERGILHGANVIMPNLSPTDVRDKYMLYNNKLSTGAESAQKLHELKEKISSVGYRIVCDRGDFINAE
ncbi:MAG: [FeFe] hydrogenase H-cluster radical SAM maturase HydE [Ruminococcaceae bacterium]|nr:[FeFe] hydrogenase H-cluster radical SAM maturase HydE [Oscillospiraceae bacterium]